MDWLVVRFGGERDGVKGQRGARLVRPSSESSPLPLRLKTAGEHTVLSLPGPSGLQPGLYMAESLVAPPQRSHSAPSFTVLWRPSELP